MTEDSTAQPVTHSLQQGLRVSLASFGWTIVAGTVAITLGVVGNSLVLIAFGLIGLLDGVGSATLIVHFRHSQRHESVSARHERIALIVVTAGMAAVGVATAADSGYRLSTHASTKTVLPGIALSGVSVFVLSVLAAQKRRVARRIPSHALHADGWLSAVGAGLAVVALAGTGLNAAFSWWWIDGVAAVVLGCGAIGLSIALARGPDVR